MRLLLTGTPGVGKTFLAKRLAEEFDLVYVDVNKIILQRKWFRVVAGEKEVDLRKLRGFLLRVLKKEKRVVIESHLLCEFFLPCDIVVLRCRPDVLFKRLSKRSYSLKKTSDNVLSEVLDYCVIKAEERYKNVFQVDNSKPLTVQKFFVYLKKKQVFDWSEWLLKERFIKQLHIN